MKFIIQRSALKMFVFNYHHFKLWRKMHATFVVSLGIFFNAFRFARPSRYSYTCPFSNTFCIANDQLTEFFDGCRRCVCKGTMRLCEAHPQNCEIDERLKLGLLAGSFKIWLENYCRKVERKAYECRSFSFRFENCGDFIDNYDPPNID